ncbi:MAG: pteridine reductase [Gammaproteobacteria bacterium]|jgi:pteridine reductase|nr:pteridine reductase [Gammaproteobacteria bacterium]MBQ0773183.1 pteridine reductase [Gammaproteobacteria bacterium]
MANDTPVALITGAARRIGKAITETLHQRGMNVVIHYRHSDEDANQLAAALNQVRADSARTLQADLDEPDAVRALAADALAQWQRLDVLVNNASSFYATPIAQANDEDWTRLMHSNLRAPLLLTQALAPALGEQRGSIVNLIDVYAQKPLFEHSLYCMAKAALASLTISSARELGPNVRVNGVAPGPIMWPEPTSPEQGQMNQQDIVAATALKRTGEPSDIANAVTWLALDAPFVTGQVVAVDGGRSLSFSGG